MNEITNRFLPDERDQNISFDGATIQSGISAVAEIVLNSLHLTITPESLEAFKTRIIDEFFESKQSQNCHDENQICFKLKHTEIIGRSWSFSIRAEDYLGEEVSLQLESGLSDALSERHPILIKTENTNPLVQPQLGVLNNTLRSIHEGEVVEFSVARFRQSEYSFLNPQVENINNRVCLAPFRECREGNWECSNTSEEDYNCRSECTGGQERYCNRWDFNYLDSFGRPTCRSEGFRCRSSSQVCDRRRTCSRLTAPPIPSLPYRIGEVNPIDPSFRWSCTNEVGAQCAPDQWENQWQRITRYSNPFQRMELQERPITSSDWDHLKNELIFHFSNGVDCKMGDLATGQVSDQRLLIRFRNTELCHPFTETTVGRFLDPSLSIINNVSISSSFRCGEMWENFRGDRRYSCILSDGTNIQSASTSAEDEVKLSRGERIGLWRPYYPRVEIESVFRFVGGYFQTNAGHWID